MDERNPEELEGSRFDRYVIFFPEDDCTCNSDDSLKSAEVVEEIAARTTFVACSVAELFTPKVRTCVAELMF